MVKDSKKDRQVDDLIDQLVSAEYRENNKKEKKQGAKK